MFRFLTTFRITLIVSILFILQACSDDEDDSGTPVVTISATDFEASIDENPSSGQVIGQISASSNGEGIVYTITNQNPSGAMSVNSNGELLVANASLFVFAENTVITATLLLTDGEASDEITARVSVNDPDAEEASFTVWSGAKITFTKADGANPGQAANQDRITDNVWITRGNNGGQIYNAVTETSANQQTSPADTEWAIGTTDDITNLTFDTFRETIRPQNVVGTDLVLHLITDDIYIDVRFTGWSQNKNGGFAYQRSTE